jgi:hypothetical protein
LEVNNAGITEGGMGKRKMKKVEIKEECRKLIRILFNVTVSISQH